MLASAQKSDGSQSQRLPEKRCTDFLLIELLLTSYSKGESCDRPSRIVVARHPVLQVYNFSDGVGESKFAVALHKSSKDLGIHRNCMACTVHRTFEICPELVPKAWNGYEGGA